MTQVNIKRVYDEPSEQDGCRVLVDRLWPRGMKREYLKYEYGAKKDGGPLRICIKRNWKNRMRLKRSLIR